jgi:ribosome-binding protein aMBF1 (putative translation factor)
MKMAINKKLATYLAERKKTDAYWVESAKLDFAMALEKQIRLAGLSYANLAKKIGTSAAYISKVFRGDTNMTIETMVKLSRASGARLQIEVVNEAVAAKTVAAQRWGNKVSPLPVTGSGSQVTAVCTTVTEFADHFASNSEIERRAA